MPSGNVYNGNDWLRFGETGEGAPAGSMIFSGNSRSESAFAFLSGFMRPSSGETETTAPEGQAPGIVNIQTTAGGTQLGDVAVTLTPAEQEFVAQWPDFFGKLANFVQKYQLFIWPVVFLFFLSVFAKIRK